MGAPRSTSGPLGWAGVGQGDWLLQRVYMCPARLDPDCHAVFHEHTSRSFHPNSSLQRQGAQHPATGKGGGCGHHRVSHQTPPTMLCVPSATTPPTPHIPPCGLVLNLCKGVTSPLVLQVIMAQFSSVRTSCDPRQEGRQGSPTTGEAMYRCLGKCTITLSGKPFPLQVCSDSVVQDLRALSCPYPAKTLWICGQLFSDSFCKHQLSQ